MGHTFREQSLYGDDLVEAARDCLKQIGIENVTCRYVYGTLFLRGVVPSYYHKQQVQEAVVGLKGVTEVRNEIAVAAPKPR